MIPKGRRMGPFIKAYRGRLAAAGLSQTDIEAAVGAITNRPAKTKLKLKRIVIRRITEILEQQGRVVIVMWRKGKIKVYSYSGHLATAANAKKNKPWESKHSPALRLKATDGVRAVNGMVEAR